MSPAMDLRSVDPALRRMLANGPLTNIPKRPGDQELLARLAAARFDPGRDYTEAEVNETLKAWLATFVEPYGIDHVTLRRMLVDTRLLVRPKDGARYALDSARLPEAAALSDIEPARVLDEVREQREERKRQHAQ